MWRGGGWGGDDIYGEKCPKGLLWCLWKYIWEPVWRIIKGFISFCNTAKSTGRLWLKWWLRRLAVCTFVLIFYRDTGNVQSLFCHRKKKSRFSSLISNAFENAIPFTLSGSQRHIRDAAEGRGGLCWQFIYVIPLRKSSWWKWLSFGHTCLDLWPKQHLTHFIGSVGGAVWGLGMPTCPQQPFGKLIRLDGTISVLEE